MLPAPRAGAVLFDKPVVYPACRTASSAGSAAYPTSSATALASGDAASPAGSCASPRRRRTRLAFFNLHVHGTDVFLISRNIGNAIAKMNSQIRNTQSHLQGDFRPQVSTGYPFEGFGSVTPQTFARPQHHSFSSQVLVPMDQQAHKIVEQACSTDPNEISKLLASLRPISLPVGVSLPSFPTQFMSQSSTSSTPSVSPLVASTRSSLPPVIAMSSNARVLSSSLPRPSATVRPLVQQKRPLSQQQISRMQMNRQVS